MSYKKKPNFNYIRSVMANILYVKPIRTLSSKRRRIRDIENKYPDKYNQLVHRKKKVGKRRKIKKLSRKNARR